MTKLMLTVSKNRCFVDIYNLIVDIRKSLYKRHATEKILAHKTLPLTTFFDTHPPKTKP